MARILLIGFLVLLAFAGTVVILLAVNNQLEPGAMGRLFGGESDETPMPELDDPLGPLARRLQSEEERLRTWEAELEERDRRLAQREQDLAKLREEIVQRQEQMEDVLDRLDAQQAQNIQEVAKRIEEMDEDEAALVLAEFPPEQSAEILRNLSARASGGILDAMTQDKRTLILQLMQEPLY